MAEKKRGLGKSLDILLSTVKATSTSAPSPVDATMPQPVEARTQFLDGDLTKLPIELLQRGKYQPRRDIQPEALQELADSIRAQGILQPLVVRSVTPGKYEIIAGERRWRAAQLAGLSEVPVIIRDVPDEAAMAMALIENIQRENLNPIEEAIALQRLLEEFQLTHQQIAEAVGKSRTTITNILRLTHLHADVQRMLERGDLEAGHAKVLLALENAAQLQAARTVVAKELSVRETEQLVKRLQNPVTAVAKNEQAADIRNLQQKLSDQLGAAVQIQHGNKGKGKLIIPYNSLDELGGILEHIK